MIWVLLQSESPWKRNDAITFFIYLCVSLYQEFFLRNRLREFAPAIIVSIMAKFEQIRKQFIRADSSKGWFIAMLTYCNCTSFSWRVMANSVMRDRYATPFPSFDTLYYSPHITCLSFQFRHE